MYGEYALIMTPHQMHLKYLPDLQNYWFIIKKVTKIRFVFSKGLYRDFKHEIGASHISCA